MVLEKTLDNKEINPVNPKRNNFWLFIGRTDAEAEVPILWPPNVKNGFIGKDPDAGKDWRQDEKGMTEDEMVGWHHRLEGHEFEQAPGVGDGQGSLASCSPWGHKELDMPEWLNWLTGSQKCFTKARNTLKRKRPGAPLDLRHPILISSTEACITLTVRNKLIESLIATTLLCKINAWIIFFHRTTWHQGPTGVFLTLSSLGSFSYYLVGFGSNLRCSPREGLLFIKHFGERSLV